MASKNKKQFNQQAPRKKSKRQKRMTFIIYLMVFIMLLSSILAGASMFL